MFDWVKNPKQVYDVIEEHCTDDVVRYFDCAKNVIEEKKDVAFKYSSKEISLIESILNNSEYPEDSKNLDARYYKDIAKQKLHFLEKEGYEQAGYEKTLVDIRYGWRCMK